MMQTDLISRSALIKMLDECVDTVEKQENKSLLFAFGEFIKSAPAVDAVPVVRCECCVLHGHCTVEDIFTLSGFTDGYCRAGKRMSNAVSGARMDGESEVDD